jgi:hypothetical protein
LSLPDFSKALEAGLLLAHLLRHRAAGRLRGLLARGSRLVPIWFGAKQMVTVRKLYNTEKYSFVILHLGIVFGNIISAVVEITIGGRKSTVCQKMFFFK